MDTTRHFKRAKRMDRLARYVISFGGATIIVCVLAILALIVKVTLPLFTPAQVVVVGQVSAPNNGDARIVAAGTDDYLETVFRVDQAGTFTFYDVKTSRLVDAVTLPEVNPGARVADVVPHGNNVYSVRWSDGAVSIEQVVFSPVFDQHQQRTIAHELKRVAVVPAVTNEPMPVRSMAVSADDGSRVTRVDLLPGNRFMVTRQTRKTSPVGRPKVSSRSFALPFDKPEAVTHWRVDSAGVAVYAATANGELLRWVIKDTGVCKLVDRFRPFADDRAITAMALVCGDMSLALGDSKGGLTTWCPVSVTPGSNEKRLRRLHTLASHPASITAIIPSHRNKCLLSLDAEGEVCLDHMTSEKRLLSVQMPHAVQTAGLALNGAGMVGLSEDGGGFVWQVDNPHPEISLKTLFGKVWYEGAEDATYVWQSSAASDDVEPKLSLIPLLFGTIKGTLYAMLFSVPLALFGALYVSQLTGPSVRRIVKPAIEVMAAVPSVVVGFLAALWFAPLVERHVVVFFLALVTIPATLLAALVLWQAIRQRAWAKRVGRGFEFVMVIPVILVAVYAAIVLAPPVERLLFQGDFSLWLSNATGLRYDLRNCIVIGFALGFAVVPIVFTLAEDSLSNVPYIFTAASLALGASRWQTVWNIVLPSASPGIFAGIMIGFGRAIGETMIVLMATGNTPIMDWSIFNGMRALSANIAVEIPEAPMNGTLYRVLFLSAVLLFVLTFTLNTLAEVIRHRLRKKYGRY